MSAHDIPTEEECREIMHQHGMRDNIVRHSIQVMRVSLALVDNLREPSTINRDLVRAGALLHDIAKTRTLETGELRHDLIGGNLLRDKGYDDIARIVESHVVFEGFRADGPLEEREIVFYADKRVMHDQIVSLDERIEDLIARYGTHERIRAMIRENRAFVSALERKLQSYLIREIEDILADL